MLPIDPGDRPGSVTPAQPLHDTATPLREIVPLQAIAHGGTILRPGAVAWGSLRDARDGGYSSCEAIERTLAAVARDPGGLLGLLLELAACRLWVPLPDRGSPPGSAEEPQSPRPRGRDERFVDGAAVRLPLVGYQGADYVPCFTSVQRLTAWSPQPEDEPARACDHREAPFWQRAGDARTVPHVVVPAIGLARRLPAGLGLALNPGSSPGLPLHPECVPYLARLSAPAIVTGPGSLPQRGHGMTRLVARTGVSFLIGPPPAEPSGLLLQARAGLAALPQVRDASVAWLSVRGAGEGLVIAVTLDDPASEPARSAAQAALERAAAAVPLRVPFALDVTFPGEPVPLTEAGPDVVADWIAGNVRPFYTRG